MDVSPNTDLSTMSVALPASIKQIQPLNNTESPSNDLKLCTTVCVKEQPSDSPTTFKPHLRIGVVGSVGGDRLLQAERACPILVGLAPVSHASLLLSRAVHERSPSGIIIVEDSPSLQKLDQIMSDILKGKNLKPNHHHPEKMCWVANHNKAREAVEGTELPPMYATKADGARMQITDTGAVFNLDKVRLTKKERIRVRKQLKQQREAQALVRNQSGQPTQPASSSVVQSPSLHGPEGALHNPIV